MTIITIPTLPTALRSNARDDLTIADQSLFEAAREHDLPKFRLALAEGGRPHAMQNGRTAVRAFIEDFMAYESPFYVPDRTRCSITILKVMAYAAHYGAYDPDRADMKEGDGRSIVDHMAGHRHMTVRGTAGIMPEVKIILQQIRSKAINSTEGALGIRAALIRQAKTVRTV